MPLSARTRLRLESLEARENPALTAVNATLDGGVLTLTGDSGDNGLAFEVGTDSTTITPDSNTSVNGQPAGQAVTLMGSVQTLRAALGGGDDHLALSGGDLVLPGGARIDLGAGDDSLNLVTDGRIELASLAIQGGDGSDTVSVAAGAGLGSSIAGAATIAGGLGAYSVSLGNLAFSGSTGLMVRGSSGPGGAAVNLDGVAVAGPLTLCFINTQADISVTGSTLGRLVSSGNSATLDIGLTQSGVDGNVQVTGPGSVALDLTKTTVGGGVTLGGVNASLTAADAALTGDAAVSATAAAGVTADGPFAARNLSVRSPAGAAAFQANATVTVAGNISVCGPAGATVGFAPGTQGEVTGNLTVAGGRQADSFTAGPSLRVDGNLTLNLGGGSNTVSIGGTDSRVRVGGNLAVRTTDGADSIGLTYVEVDGSTQITTGAGDDSLNVDWGSIFGGPFVANLGDGADTIALAQSVGAPQPVAFGDILTIQAGAGKDTLLLGKAFTAGGDANSAALVRAAGNTIDGGTGPNFFDADVGQVILTGVATTLTLPDWPAPGP